MSDFQLKTPVAFVIFNRPETTKRVFAEIARARPPKLLIIADGPRADQPDDVKKCAATRSIVDNVDWNCEVLTNYSETNLGCKRRVSSGLDWVFDTVEEAIILEDDCLPNPTFFRFCEELLVKYRNDERIAMISGDNFQFGKKLTKNSYYFSRYNHIWGWASWRRAWNNYDVDMKVWPKIREQGLLKNYLGSRIGYWYWRYIFDNVYNGKIDTWDYQWTFSCWIQNTLTIIPKVNLISNIGFGMKAEHTKVKNKFAEMETESMIYPILHPEHILSNSNADSYVENIMFSGKSLMLRVIHRFINKIKNR